MAAITLTLETTIVASREQVSCELGGEAAILGLANSQYYGLDPVGARAWALMQQPSTIASVRDAIAAEYDVREEQLESDLLDLVHDLLAEGLVDVVTKA